MIRLIEDFLKEKEQRAEKEYQRKKLEVRWVLINFFEEPVRKDLIPSWMRADETLEEWEQRGIIETQYKKLVKYGLVA